MNNLSGNNNHTTVLSKYKFTWSWTLGLQTKCLLAK